MGSYRSLKEQNDFVTACEEGILCDEQYCPYVEGVSGRMGSCDGDFCEMAWDNYCDKNDKEYEQ